MVDVDPIGIDAERRESVALGGEVLPSVETRSPRALAASPGQPIVDVDPPGIDTERGELGGEILTDGVEPRA
jgi:hypothetical protein